MFWGLMKTPARINHTFLSFLIHPSFEKFRHNRNGIFEGLSACYLVRQIEHHTNLLDTFVVSIR